MLLFGSLLLLPLRRETPVTPAPLALSASWIESEDRRFALGPQNVGRFQGFSFGCGSKHVPNGLPWEMEPTTSACETPTHNFGGGWGRGSVRRVALPTKRVRRMSRDMMAPDLGAR